MDVMQLKRENEIRLSRERYEHVVRVTETAKTLAKCFNINEEKAEIAALFHDIAKCMEKEELRQFIEKNDENDELLTFHHELWHAPVGAIIAHHDFNVTDEDILNAIRYHTTGRKNMSSLEKVIYVADMIEPGRDFPGIETLRSIASKDIDMAMAACIHQTVTYLVNKKTPVHPLSISCYNEHMELERKSD